MRPLLMSRLIKIFTVFSVNLFFIPITELLNKQGGCPNLAVCLNIPDFTLHLYEIFILKLYNGKNVLLIEYQITCYSDVDKLIKS